MTAVEQEPQTEDAQEPQRQEPQQPQRPIVPPDRLGRERFLKEMEAQLTIARNQQDLQYAQMMQVEQQQAQLQRDQGAQAQQLGAMEQSEMLMHQMRTNAPRMPEMSEGFDAEINRLSPTLAPERVQQLRITKSRIQDFSKLLPDIDEQLKAGMAPTMEAEGAGDTSPLLHLPGNLMKGLAEGLASPFTGAPLSGRERVLQSAQQAARGIEEQYIGPFERGPQRTNLDVSSYTGTIDDRGAGRPNEPFRGAPTKRLPEGMSPAALHGVIADRMETLLEQQVGDKTTARDFTRHVGNALGWLAPFSAASKVGGAVTRGIGLAGKAAEGGALAKVADFTTRELIVPGAAMFAWGTQRDLAPDDQLKVDQAPAGQRRAVESALHLRRGMQEGMLMPLYAAHMGGAGLLLKRSPVLRGLLIGGTAPAVGEAGEAMTDQLAKAARGMGFQDAGALADYYAARGTYGPVTAFLRDPSWEHAKAYAAAALPNMTAFGALGFMHRAQDQARFESRKVMLTAVREAHEEIDAAVAAGKVEPDVGEAMKADASKLANDLAPSHAEDRGRVAKERHEEAAGGAAPAKAETEDRMGAARLEHLPGATLAEKRAGIEEKFAELDAKEQLTPEERGEQRALANEYAATGHLERGGTEARARAVQLLEKAQSERKTPQSGAKSPEYQGPGEARAADAKESIREAAAGPLPETKAREGAVEARDREHELVGRDLITGTARLKPVEGGKPFTVREADLINYRVRGTERGAAPARERDPLTEGAVEKLKGQKRVSAPFLMKALGVGRRRAEGVLRDLVDEGHVYREGRAHKVRELEPAGEIHEESPASVMPEQETPPPGHPVQLEPDAERRAATRDKRAKQLAANTANRPRNIITAIAKLGGISRESWQKSYPGAKSGDYSRMRGLIAGRRKPGEAPAMSWEQMAQALVEDGYGPQAEHQANRAGQGLGAGGADHGWLIGALEEAAQGHRSLREQDYQHMGAKAEEPSHQAPDPRGDWISGLQRAEKAGDKSGDRVETLQWLRDNLSDVRDYLAELGELQPQDQALQALVEKAIARFSGGGLLGGIGFIGKPGELWFHLGEGASAIYRFVRGSGAFARQRFLNERTVRTAARKVRSWLDQVRGAIGLYGAAGSEAVTAVETSYRMRERMQAMVMKVEKEVGGVDSDLDHALTLAVESFSRPVAERTPEETAAWAKIDGSQKRALVEGIRHVLAETREMSAERHPVHIALKQVTEGAERVRDVLQSQRDAVLRELEQAEDPKDAKRIRRRLRGIEGDLRFQEQRVAKWSGERAKFVAEWGRRDYMPHVPDPAMMKDLAQDAERLNVDMAASPILKMAGHWRRRTGALEAMGQRDPSAVKSLWHYLTQVVPLATMTDYEVRNEGAIYGTRRALSGEEVNKGGQNLVEYVEGRDVLLKRNLGRYWEVTAKGGKPQYVRRLEEIPAEQRQGARTRRVVLLDDMLQGQKGTQVHPESVAGKPGRFTVVAPGTARRAMFVREGGLLSELGQAKRNEYEEWHRRVHKVFDESAGLADYGLWDKVARKIAHALSAKDIASFHPGPAIRNLLQTLILNGNRLGVRRALLTIHMPLNMAARLHAAVKGSSVAELLKGVESQEVGAHVPLRNTHLAKMLGTSPELLERMNPKRRAEAMLQDEAFRELLDSPAFSSSIVHDLDGMSASEPGKTPWTEWLPIIGSKQWAMFRGTESFSRWHLFLDSFVQARQNGMGAAEARQHANDTVLNSHGYGNRAARSAAMQAPLLRVALYMSGWMQHATGTLMRAALPPTATGARRWYPDVAGLRHSLSFAGYLIGTQQLAQWFLGKDWARLVGGTLSEVPVIGGTLDDQARKGLAKVGLPEAFQGEIPVPVLPGTWGLAAAPIAEHGIKAVAAWWKGDAKTAGGEWDRFSSRLLPNWLRTYRRGFEGEENPEHPDTHFTKEWATGRRIETLPGDLSLGSGAYRTLSDMFGPDIDEQRRWRQAEQDRMRQEIGAAERRTQGFRLGTTARELTQLDRARKQPGGDTAERAGLAKQLEKTYVDTLEEVARDRDLRTKGQVAQLHWETMRIAQMDQELTSSQRSILNAPTLDERVGMFSRALNDSSYPLTPKEATEILTLMVGKSLAEGKPDAFKRWLKLVPPASAKVLVEALNSADKRWRKQ